MAYFPALGAHSGRRFAAISAAKKAATCVGVFGGSWRALRAGLREAGGSRAERPKGWAGPDWAYSERSGFAGRGCGRVPAGPGPYCLLQFFSLYPPDPPGMAGVFPYRGPGNPVPGPLAPLPDYMSEEKLQEKGEERVRERRLRAQRLRAGVRVRAAGLLFFCFFVFFPRFVKLSALL